jgi:thiol:disulfide interchange protein DsbC
MKRAANYLLTAVLALVLQPAHSAPDEERVLAAVRNAYPATVLDRALRTPIPGIYEIWMGANVAFVSAKNPRYVVFGRLVDLKTMRDLTAERMASNGAKPPGVANQGLEAPTYTGPMPVADAITVVRGDGRRELSVFTDPACGYCRELERHLRELQNVTIRYYLLPFQGESLPLAIWCANDRPAAYAAAMAGSVTPSDAKGSCSHPLERNRRLASRLRVGATPTLLFADGTMIPGLLTAEELESRLSANRSTTPQKEETQHATSKP